MGSTNERSKVPELSSWARSIAESISAIDYLEISNRRMRTVKHTFESCGIFKVGFRANRLARVGFVIGVLSTTVGNTISTHSVCVGHIRAIRYTVSSDILHEISIWTRKDTDTIRQISELRSIRTFLNTSVGIIFAEERWRCWTYRHTSPCRVVRVVVVGA